MLTRTTIAIVAIGVALTILGLGLGLAPASILDTKALYPPAATRTLGCGSPWATDYGQAATEAFALTPTEAAQRCEDVHGSRGGLGLLTLGLGLATLIELGVVKLIRHAIAQGEQERLRRHEP